MNPQDDTESVTSALVEALLSDHGRGEALWQAQEHYAGLPHTPHSIEQLRTVHQRLQDAAGAQPANAFLTAVAAVVALLIASREQAVDEESRLWAELERIGNQTDDAELAVALWSRCSGPKMMQGQVEAGLELCRRALQLAGATPSRRCEAVTLSHAGLGNAVQGNFGCALMFFEHAERVFVQHGPQGSSSRLLNLINMAQLIVEESEERLEDDRPVHLAQCAETLERVERLLGQPVVGNQRKVLRHGHTVASRLSLLVGQIERARRHADEAAAIAADMPALHQALAAEMQAHVALVCEQPTQALAQLDEAARLIDVQAASQGGIRYWRLRHQALLALSQHEAAAQAAQRAYMLLRRAHQHRLKASTDSVLRQLALDQSAALRMVSHDLRAPLAAVMSTLENTDESADARCIAAAEGVRRALDQTDQASAYLAATLETATSNEEVDLDGLVDDVVDEYLQAAQQRDVVIRTSPGKAVLTGTHHLLARALANLLSNAIRHSPPGNTVEMKAWSDLVSVYVQVTDAGPGFDWTRVKRVSLSPSESGLGGGIGLRFVSRVATRHGGALRLSNRAQGGACAVLIFPVRRIDNERGPPAAP